MVWEENWPAKELFADMMTQWRTGFNGRTGLDYSVLPVMWDLHNIKKDQQRARFDELRIMEAAALEAMKE